MFFVSAFSVGTQSLGASIPLLLGEISGLANDYTEVVHQNEEKMEINMDKYEVQMNVDDMSTFFFYSTSYV